LLGHQAGAVHHSKLRGVPIAVPAPGAESRRWRNS
jgi:hypothetical protein